MNLLTEETLSSLSVEEVSQPILSQEPFMSHEPANERVPGQNSGIPNSSCPVDFSRCTPQQVVQLASGKSPPDFASFNNRYSMVHASHTVIEIIS